MNIDLVRAHLRIDEEPSENDLLLHLIDAAKSHVEQHCDRIIVEGNPSGPEQMLMTDDIKHAMLLLIGHWYSNREGVVVGAPSNEVQLGVERLLRYRKRY